MSEAMIGAAICGDAAQVRALLADDASLANWRDPRLGSVPLIYAAHRGHLEVVEVLLAGGAEVDARETGSGTTALHWAAEGGHMGVAQRLLEAGAEIEAVDQWFGLTPLGWGTAVDWAPGFRSNRPATVELLLARDARMDPFAAIVMEEGEALRAMAPERLAQRLGFVGEGQQPLHFAAARGNARLVRLLVELGAGPNERSGFGLTPLAEAVRAGQAETAAALRALGAAEDLGSALLAGDLELAQSFRPPAEESRLLHICVAAGRTAAVRVLLEMGADRQAVAPYLIGEVRQEVTALRLAELRQDSAMIELLRVG